MTQILRAPAPRPAQRKLASALPSSSQGGHMGHEFADGYLSLSDFQVNQSHRGKKKSSNFSETSASNMQFTIKQKICSTQWHNISQRKYGKYNQQEHKALAIFINFSVQRSSKTKILSSTRHTIFMLLAYKSTHASFVQNVGNFPPTTVKLKPILSETTKIFFKRFIYSYRKHR